MLLVILLLYIAEKVVVVRRHSRVDYLQQQTYAGMCDETKRQGVDRITLRPKPQSLCVVKPTENYTGMVKNGLSLGCH